MNKIIAVIYNFNNEYESFIRKILQDNEVQKYKRKNNFVCTIHYNNGDVITYIGIKELYQSRGIKFDDYIIVDYNFKNKELNKIIASITIRCKNA